MSHMGEYFAITGDRMKTHIEQDLQWEAIGLNTQGMSAPPHHS